LKLLKLIRWKLNRGPWQAWQGSWHGPYCTNGLPAHPDSDAQTVELSLDCLSMMTGQNITQSSIPGPPTPRITSRGAGENWPLAVKRHLYEYYGAVQLKTTDVGQRRNITASGIIERRYKHAIQSTFLLIVKMHEILSYS
jgi:hypothetical protein